MIGLNDNLLQNILCEQLLIFSRNRHTIHLIKQKSLIIQNVHAHIVSIAKLLFQYLRLTISLNVYERNIWAIVLLKLHILNIKNYKIDSYRSYICFALKIYLLGIRRYHDVLNK